MEISQRLQSTCQFGKEQIINIDDLCRVISLFVYLNVLQVLLDDFFQFDHLFLCVGGHQPHVFPTPISPRPTCYLLGLVRGNQGIIKVTVLIPSQLLNLQKNDPFDFPDPYTK